MKMKKMLSCVLIALGLAVAAAAVWLCFSNLNAQPVLLNNPEEAEVCTEKFMEAVGKGDYGAAGMMMYGTPDLGVARLPENPVGGQIWYSFQNSLSYEFRGECYASDTGVARDVTIRAMDMEAVLDILAQRAPEAISQKTHNTNDFSLIYDENNKYREDFVFGILQDILMQILSEDYPYVSDTVTLELVFEDGQWWIVPGQELIGVISGGIVG